MHLLARHYPSSRSSQDKTIGTITPAITRDDLEPPILFIAEIGVDGCTNGDSSCLPENWPDECNLNDCHWDSEYGGNEGQSDDDVSETSILLLGETSD